MSGKGDMRRPALIPASVVARRYESTLGPPKAVPCPQCGGRSLRITNTATAQRLTCQRCRHLIQETKR